MIKYILCILLFATTAIAGDGHNHGDSGFADAVSATTFDLTQTQEHNLDLKTAKVKKMTFFETLVAPCVVKKTSLDSNEPLIQAFIMEGVDFSNLEKGQSVTIKLDMYPKKTFAGQVVQIDALMDGRSRLYSFWVRPQNLPSKSLGFKGEVVVKTGIEEQALGIPKEAINGEFGNLFVFAKQGNHIEKLHIATGHKMGDFVEVVGGLKQDEVVVTQGSYQLQYVSGLEEEHKTESGDN